MSDPKRLLGAGSDFERAVLGSALDDEPPTHLRKKLVVALGVGGATTVGTSGVAGAAAATTKWVASIGLGKVVAVAAVGGGLALGAAVTANHVASRARVVATAGSEGKSARSEVSAVAPRSSPVFAPTAPPVLVASEPAPDPLASHSTPPIFIPNARAHAHATPARPIERTSPPPSVTASPAAPPPSDALVGELALLDRADAALRAGDVGQALSRLDEHDAAYPAGPLAPESLALRIEAHAAGHDDTRVRELVEAFALRYPGHPYTHRLRALVRDARNSPNTLDPPNASDAK